MTGSSRTPDVVGEWSRGRGADRVCLRVRSRGGNLDLEARHVVTSLKVVRNGQSAWSAVRGDEDNQVIYNLTIAADGHLAMKAPEKEDPAAEFVRSTARPGEVCAASRSCSRSQREHSATPQRSRGQGVAENASHEQLAEEVKNRQRSSQTVNMRWREFCERDGQTSFDPLKHDVQFLRRFLDTMAKLSPGDLRPRSCSHEATRKAGRHVSPSIDSRGSARGGRGRKGSKGRKGRKKRRDKKKKGREGRGRETDRRKKHRRKRGAEPASSSGSTSAESSEGSRSSSARSKSMAGSPQILNEKPPQKEQAAAVAAARKALVAAVAAKESAEKALSIERDASINTIAERIRTEEDRQRNQVSRHMEKVEYEAKQVEEEEIREATRKAREVCEVKILEARKAAEDDARRVVLAVERRVKTESASTLEDLERKLRTASEELERCEVAVISGGDDRTGGPAGGLLAAAAANIGAVTKRRAGQGRKRAKNGDAATADLGEGVANEDEHKSRSQSNEIKAKVQNRKGGRGKTRRKRRAKHLNGDSGNASDSYSEDGASQEGGRRNRRGRAGHKGPKRKCSPGTR